MKYWELLLILTREVVDKCFYPKEVDIVVVSPDSKEYIIKKLRVINSRGTYGTIEIFLQEKK